MTLFSLRLGLIQEGGVYIPPLKQGVLTPIFDKFARDSVHFSPKMSFSSSEILERFTCDQQPWNVVE